MNMTYAAVTVVALVVLGALAGVSSPAAAVVSVVVPYAAFAVFLLGVSLRVARWAASPVPFRIPTTCGQQKSLPWIRSATIDNPATTWGVVARMLLEVLLFRSLFRNRRAELNDRRYVFGDSKWLWLGALAFHGALVVILVRHLRLFVQPVPACVTWLAGLDGFFQVGFPVLYLSNVVIAAALVYLLVRRVRDPRLRYISQFTDYFAPLLILGVCLSGMVMRYVTRVDVVALKQHALGLATFSPLIPQGVSPVFLVHLLLVSALAAYLPFSKLMHLGGILLSPTRNLANNSREKRHVNPWNPPVKTHPYVEWEEEYRDKLKMAGIPLDGAHDA